MASLKEIRNRIASVKNTQKITSAMKMVSSAKMARAQKAIESALPYSQKLKQVVSSLSRGFTEEDHPLFYQSEGNKVSVILITSDRGLCGGFNSNLCKKLFRELDRTGSTAELTVIGKKGRDFFKSRHHRIHQSHIETPAEQQLSQVRDIVKEVIQRFENHETDRVYLAYNRFLNVVSQTPMVETLLPIAPPEVEVVDDREMLFEPSAEQILDTLLKKYVENQVYVGWLSSVAGEHAARMTAMDSATKNAGDMIDKLRLFYNRSRQAVITKELIEIISGAESL